MHLSEANRALQELRNLKAVVTYRIPPSYEAKGDQSVYLAFSDARSGSSSYGQTGYVSGIFFPSSRIYHVIDWHSSKQKRVSFSSIGAEILAADESAGRASFMTYLLNEMYTSTAKLPFVLTVDSHGLYSTVSTLHERQDYCLRPTVARIRDSFETGEIDVLQWIRGTKNVADALTKRNQSTNRLLIETCKTCTLPSTIFEKTERVIHSEWQ